MNSITEPELGSSCIYPRMAPQPMKESCLLTSELEKTNEAYALAKISGLKYCEFLNRQYGTDYISVMPTNLYGPNDNYGLPKSDVLKFLLEDNCSLVVRPSGTEPKLKIYISVSAENKEMAEEVEDEIAKTAEKWIC